MGDDLRNAAAHEAGHAVAAHLLGRLVVLVSLEGPYGGGPCSVDRHPRETLQAQRRPEPHWYALETDALITWAGPLCEHYADEYEQDVADEDRTFPIHAATGRTQEPEPPAPIPLGLPTPVIYQGEVEPEVFPVVPFNDYDTIERLVRGITSSEEEYVAFDVALRMRAEAMVRHDHFRALHRRLTAALMREGELTASDIRHELQRAELAHSMSTTTTEPEADDGSQAA